MGSDEGSGVYACDLVEGLAEEELWQVFGNYGEVLSMEQVTGEDAVVVGYAEQEAADEARGMLNYASVKGKTCRCLTMDMLEVIRRTMDTGQRLIIEQLDPAIDSCGLRDVCSLFGQVLDCKVELDEVPDCKLEADEERHARSRGFVHFSCDEEAAKAATFLAGMQIGCSVVETRPFEPADIVLFSGCRYSAGRAGAARVAATDSDCPAPPDTLEEEPVPAPVTPEEMESSVLQHFRSLRYHHVEVLQDVQLKLARLKTLIELYDPTHEMQVVVVARPAHLQAVAGLLGQCLEDCDFDTLEPTMSKASRQAVIEGYETGNLYVVTLSSEACTRREYYLGKPASVLINFDCPRTVQLHLHGMFKRAECSTRVHNFFTPSTDGKLALPLLKACEEAGHEVPPELYEMWSAMDLKA